MTLWHHWNIYYDATIPDNMCKWIWIQKNSLIVCCFKIDFHFFCLDIKTSKYLKNVVVIIHMMADYMQKKEWLDVLDFGRICFALAIKHNSEDSIRSNHIPIKRIYTYHPLTKRYRFPILFTSLNFIILCYLWNFCNI